jgi:dTDP-4-amino-4,6-dideoxygalactose transaminase
LEDFIAAKRKLASAYSAALQGSDLSFFTEPDNCRSNYWLNAVICEDSKTRDRLLKETNEGGVMTRPIWQLMNHLSMYGGCLRGDLTNSEWLAERIVNLPSSVISELPD